jgi:hypothetical protein
VPRTIRPDSTTRPHRKIFIHLTAAVVVPGCLVLCWWQVTRALSGNTLSWAYVFEWPIFAGYGVFLWWKLIHDRPAGNEAGEDEAGEKGPSPVETADAEDEELASYNRYLAALNASGRRKHW